MIRRPPRSTRTDTLFPYTTLFRSVVANVLDVDAARLTGTVQLPIVDAIRKREELEKAVETYGIASELTMAVGDGANDILMMQAAGLGVDYPDKQKAREAADAEIDRKRVV